MRILAIDYGRKKCGIAISDSKNKVAIPYGTIETENLFSEIERLIEKKNISKIVIGLPLSLSGKEIEITGDIYRLKQKIEEMFKLEVILLDERMTSKIFKKDNVDDLSAMILLQDYLKLSSS
ncbi:MAG: Holliday junction resolvase RuvX [candidate division WOR-3 bacterium]|nr:Holliday junction resolvase RuvX [candidate division WOR-3 bacterium]MCX7947628.1 Holliday junction resolvase RuvX [candidate division WOR-3 bacterium]MDW8150506.1 Holliday junction resolvase RuvX [candidate division WOR-3 bacterium]